jgi:hypothetical protein
MTCRKRRLLQTGYASFSGRTVSQAAAGLVFNQVLSPERFEGGHVSLVDQIAGPQELTDIRLLNLSFRD